MRSVPQDGRPTGSPGGAAGEAGGQGSGSAAIEAPTVLVALAVYLGWGLVTWHYQTLPWWLVLPLGAWLTCWHGSLQHEIVHGHPTRWSWVNAAIAWPPLSLWLPYPLYRDSHIRHHRVGMLTCPIDDPESFYVTPAQWQALPSWRRALLRFNQTPAGRLLIGPALVLADFLRAEGRRLLNGESGSGTIWAAHLLAWLPVVLWVVIVCGIPLWAYVALFVYPGLSLTLLRSYAEHRPATQSGHRSAIVEAAWPFRLLFLNNALHALHHERPAVPWYALPALYAAERDRILADNGGYVIPGYGALVCRRLFRMKDAPVHPGAPA